MCDTDENAKSETLSELVLLPNQRVTCSSAPQFKAEKLLPQKHRRASSKDRENAVETIAGTSGTNSTKVLKRKICAFEDSSQPDSRSVKAQAMPASCFALGTCQEICSLVEYMSHNFSGVSVSHHSMSRDQKARNSALFIKKTA